MYNVSQKFKSSIYAPVRRTTGRVTFDISDTTAAGDVSSITVTSDSPLSLKSQLINKVRSSTYRMATLEKDRFKLDGTFSFPDDTLANDGELGWSSAVIGDASGNLAKTSTLNFVGKVSGSVAENANVAKRKSGNGFTSLSAPSTFDVELTSYTVLQSLDGSLSTLSYSNVGGMAQAPFSYNLIDHMLREHGMVVDVAWLKANITSLLCNWHGWGSSATGNKAYIKPWVSVASTWGSEVWHTNNNVTKLTRGLTIGSGWNDIVDCIDNNGFVHFLAYTDPSNGTIASTINTDYVELLVTLAPQVLTFNFTSNHSSAGLTITFDEMNGEYATDFDMTAYDASNAVIATTSVTGNTDIIATPLGQLFNYRKVSVIIKKWSKPNRRARVFEVDFGIVKQYTDDSLINMNLIEEVDMLTGKLPSPEFKFTVDNVDRAFNILNPNGFYKYLQKKQQIIAEIGLEIAPNAFEYVQLGNYLLQEWKNDQGGITASFTARTNLDSMASFDYENLVSGSYSLGTLARFIFNLCGITNYYLDPVLDTITTNTLIKKANCRDILQMIAIAGCANVYVTRDNVITLKTNKTRKIRYIRDWANGNTFNAFSQWVEIQAVDSNGVNQALGKTVTCSSAINNITRITDGDLSSANADAAPIGVPISVTVDLGALFDIASVNIWHLYTSSRTYFNTKTEVSTDGVNWVTIFDSAVSGTYVETSSGRSYALETAPIPPIDTADFDNMYDEPQITLDKTVKSVGVTYWTNLSTSAEVVSTGNLFPSFDKWVDAYGVYPKVLSDGGNTETFVKNTTANFVHDRYIGGVSAIPNTTYTLRVSVTITGYGGVGGFYAFIYFLDGTGNLIGSGLTLATQTTTGDYVQTFTTPANTAKVEVGFVIHASATGTYKFSYPLLNDPTVVLGDTLKIENNTLINSAARATAVADWLFDQINYRAAYRINWRGNPAIELKDVMAFENSYGANMSAYITRIELDYAGYLTGRMQAKGAVN